MKLFLPTLLTALFSATGTLVNEKSEQLWMFQRYEIVMDYEKRLVFPPPFSILVYIYMALRWLLRRVCRACCRFRVYCCALVCCSKNNSDNNNKNKKLKKSSSENELDKLDDGTVGIGVEGDKGKQHLNPNGTASSSTSSSSSHSRPSQQGLNTYSYWTYVAQRYVHSVEQATTEKTRTKQIETNLNRLREELGTQKKSVQRLNDRVITMEKKVLLNQSYLEQIKNLLSQKVGAKNGLMDRKKKNYIHILSRESPYMSSNIFRFFVYEKLVPWECPYDLYDVNKFLF